MQAVTRLCFRLVNELANRSSVPAFRDGSRTETVATQQAVEQPSPPLPPRLGISWAARKKDEVGLVVSEVAITSPAARAGVRVGDRIIRFDEQALRDDGEFQSQVLTIEKSLMLTLERAGENKPLDVKVQLDGEPVRIGIAWRIDDAEPGAVILTRVVWASPAAHAGLQIGDRIYAVAGRRFDSSDDFLRQLNGARNAIELEVGHKGEIRKAVLDVSPRPSGHASDVPSTREPSGPPKK
jgi:aminopeptidase YwaD